MSKTSYFLQIIQKKGQVLQIDIPLQKNPVQPY